MAERRQGLILQGTSWTSDEKTRRLKKRVELGDEEAREELLRERYRRGGFCLAKAAIAIRETHTEPGAFGPQTRTLWRLPENNPIWNPPARAWRTAGIPTSDDGTPIWDLSLYFVSGSGRLRLEGPVMDQNGCVYGDHTIEVPVTFEEERQAWEGTEEWRDRRKAGDVHIGGKKYRAQNRWKEFIIEEFTPDNRTVWVEVLFIVSPGENIFA